MKLFTLLIWNNLQVPHIIGEADFVVFSSSLFLLIIKSLNEDIILPLVHLAIFCKADGFTWIIIIKFGFFNKDSKSILFIPLLTTIIPTSNESIFFIISSIINDRSKLLFFFSKGSLALYSLRSKFCINNIFGVSCFSFFVITNPSITLEYVKSLYFIIFTFI